MNCFLSPIDTFGSFDQLYYSSERQLVVSTDFEGNCKVFKFTSLDGEFQIIKELHGHSAPIVTVQFSPLIYRNYILVITLDRQIFLYDLDSPKATDPVWSYFEENKETGSFTCASFHSQGKSVLSFSIGTSAGHIILFSSEDNFEPQRVRQMDRPIISMSATSTGELAVAITGLGFFLFLNDRCSTFLRFQEDLYTVSKHWTLLFAPQTPFSSKHLLGGYSREGNIVVWEYNSNLTEIQLLSEQKMENGIIGCFWNLSGLSLYVITSNERNQDSDTQIFKLGLDLGNCSKWFLEQAHLIH